MYSSFALYKTFLKILKTGNSVLINNLFFCYYVQLIMELVIDTIRWQYDTKLLFLLKAYSLVSTSTL